MSIQKYFRRIESYYNQGVLTSLGSYDSICCTKMDTVPVSLTGMYRADTIIYSAWRNRKEKETNSS